MMCDDADVCLYREESSRRRALQHVEVCHILQYVMSV